MGTQPFYALKARMKLMCNTCNSGCDSLAGCFYPKKHKICEYCMKVEEAVRKKYELLDK
jgi:hypothetical protein